MLIELMELKNIFLIIIMIFYVWSCFVVCLDGSPPAYHFSAGFGAGINNWLIQIEVDWFFKNRNYYIVHPIL